MTRNPIFVVGNPRSGTTLIQQILAAHQPVWTAPETHMFTHVLAKFDNLTEHDFAPDELERVFRRLEKRSTLKLPDEAIEEIKAQADGNPFTAAHVIDSVMHALKPPQDPATRWLEKTPHHVLKLPLIWHFFPEARVINIVRDPRDVVSSPKRFRRHTVGASRILAVQELARRWNKYVCAADRKKQDPRLLIIRYRDFIAEPVKTLTKMANHVGIEPDPAALTQFDRSFEMATLAHKHQHKALSKTSVLVDRRGIWKKRLTEREARIVEMMCADLMERYGYEPEFPRDRLLGTKLWFMTFPQRTEKQLRNFAKTSKRTLRQLKGKLS